MHSSSSWVHDQLTPLVANYKERGMSLEDYSAALRSIAEYERDGVKGYH
jgi:hypothetical protein